MGKFSLDTQIGYAARTMKVPDVKGLKILEENVGQ